MNYVPVLKEFCQFAIDSSGLVDVVSIKMDSDIIELTSATRTQKITMTDTGCHVVDNGEDLGFRLKPIDLADVAALVVSRHVKDILAKEIKEEYKR